MKIKGRKILVTGGAGFIGSHVVDLLSENNEVTVLDDFSSGKKENIQHLLKKKKIKVINRSITDISTLKGAFKNIDIVYHLAVRCLRQSLMDPFENHEINAAGTLNVCEAAKENGVKRLIYVSSSEVYGTAKDDILSEESACYPTTVYAAAKLAGESYVQAYFKTYGLPAIIVRPFNTYGPREHHEGALGEVVPIFTIRAMNNLPLVIYGDGKQTRDFTYVSDIAHGIVDASACDGMVGQAANIAFGKGVSINEIAGIISKALNKADLAVIREPGRPGDTPKLKADIKKARKLFGYNPKVDIKKGVRLYIEWLYTQFEDPKALIEDVRLRNWEK